MDDASRGPIMQGVDPNEIAASLRLRHHLMLGQPG
jgi:hypothetical protein